MGPELFPSAPSFCSRLQSIGTSDKAGSLRNGYEILLAPNLPLHQGKAILSAFVKSNFQGRK